MAVVSVEAWGCRIIEISLIFNSFGDKRIVWEFVAAYRVGSYRLEPLQYLTQLYKKAADQKRKIK